MTKRRLAAAGCLVLMACLNPLSQGQAQGSGSATLDAARARGYVACGTSGRGGLRIRVYAEFGINTFGLNGWV